jgi:cytochrome c553
MYRYLTLIVACSLSIAAARSEGIDPNDAVAAQRIAIGTCATCHGPHGQSISPKFPVLAGQHANYLAAQMHGFKDQKRGDPDALGYMWGMAANLDDATIAALADYYSRQPRHSGPKVAGAALDRGKELYLHGNTAEGIPACAACHGANAEGTDAFPRLAGQHMTYLTKQLRSFQSNLRDVAIMHGVAQGLKGEEMNDVAAYLQSLGP